MNKKIFFTSALFCAALLGGCVKDDGRTPRSVRENGWFDFATTKIYDLNVEYRLRGYDAGILFEVYAEDPFATSLSTDGTLQKELDRTIKPAFKAITDKKGHFRGDMLLPAGLNSVWLVTSYLGVPGCVQVPVNGPALNVDMDNDYSVASRAIVQGPNHSYPGAFSFIDDRDDWDALGTPSNLNPSGRFTVPSGLISDINDVLPPGVSVASGPHAYLMQPDCSHSICIKEECALDMVFIIDGAEYLNVVGYYTYPTDAPPAKPSDIKKLIAVFPNASAKNSGGALVPGDNVRLKYWNESEGKWEDKFPAGITVGFFMHPNSFQSGDIVRDISGNNPIYYSDTKLNYYSISVNEALRQQTVALYDYKDDGRNLVVIGFEDKRRPYNIPGDNDFNDVMFYVKADPSTAIEVPGDRDPDLDPKPDEPKDYYIEYDGCLGFEDNWPSRGDYDLNDVGIKYHSTVYYNKYNRITKVVDVISPVTKGATYINGFGYQYGVDKEAVSGFNIEVSPSKPLPYAALEDGQRLATVMLFDNVLDEVDGEWSAIGQQTPRYVYTVTTEFATPQTVSAVGFPPYNPFIVVNRPNEAGGRVREVHLPGYAPTDKALASPSEEWFGRYEDRSDAAAGRWYVSEDNYPFAIHIPGREFAFPGESVRIDLAYPRFADWARSHGAINPDWYK